MFKEFYATLEKLFSGFPKIPFRPVDQIEKPFSYEINAEGLALIKSFEGFYSNAYLDSVGIPTIGYGTTVYPNGEKVKLKETCNKYQAEEWLTEHIKKSETKLAPYLKSIDLKLNSNQFSALVSFAYNLGEGPIINTGRSMNKALKSKDVTLMAEAFLLYNKAGGKVLAGLRRRREAEKKLFLKA